jgi:hypothetical protein
MKYLLILISFIVVFAFTRANAVHSVVRNDTLTVVAWNSTKNWKIYKLQNFNRVFGVSIDSLKYLENKPLNDDSMHMFLSDTKELPSMSPMWMGCYLTSYESSDGKVKKAIISHYAGFLYCQQENTYFQINSDAQQDWLTYLSSSYLNIRENRTQ